MSDVEIETKQSPACTRLPSEQQTQKVTISGTQSVTNNKTQTQKVAKSGTHSVANNKTQTQKVTVSGTQSVVNTKSWKFPTLPFHMYVVGWRKFTIIFLRDCQQSMFTLYHL